MLHFMQVLGHGPGPDGDDIVSYCIGQTFLEGHMAKSFFEDTSPSKITKGFSGFTRALVEPEFSTDHSVGASL